jgi:hypothetical protein
MENDSTHNLRLYRQTKLKPRLPSWQNARTWLRRA